MYVATGDQENCFTYVQTPEYFWLYHAAPPLRHIEFGGPAVTGLHHISLEAYVSPCYTRLAMGSSHSVDIIVAINRHAIGTCMLRSKDMHDKLVSQSFEIFILTEPKDGLGYAWEFFAGSARWTAEMRNVGFGTLTPIEINDDSRLDLSNVLFLEKTIKVARSGYVDEVHFGTPCSSLSRAITPAWRSAKHPCGVPDLRGVALAKVQVGNQLTAIAAHLLYI